MSTFRINSERLLEVTLEKEKVLALAGCMVAYIGTMKFEKAILGGEGLLGAFKRKVTGEGISLMTVSGTGTLYCAREAAQLALVSLTGEKLYLESSSLLVLDAGLKTSTAFVGLHGAVSGKGLFTTTIEGHGSVAVMARGDLIALEVSSVNPLFVDPQAFVGYKGQIQQEFVFDVNWRTMIGETSGESYQLKFSGEGVVFIQGAERG